MNLQARKAEIEQRYQNLASRRQQLIDEANATWNEMLRLQGEYRGLVVLEKAEPKPKDEVIEPQPKAVKKSK